MPTDQTEQVTDHKAEALRQLERIGGLNDLTVSELAPISTVHALLAIAEGQERVAEALEEIFGLLEAGNLTYADGMVRGA